MKVLLNRQTYLKDLEEIKSDWVYSILEHLSIDRDKFKMISIDNQRNLLEKNSISITDYPSLNAIKIEKMIDNNIETVAEFMVHSIILKLDSKTKEPYYEVEIEEWNIFE